MSRRRICRGIRVVVGYVAALGVASPGAEAEDLSGTKADVAAIDAPAVVVPAIRRALRLLPRRPQQVSVVGEERVEPDSRKRFWRSEAFVSKGSPVVYLTSHGPVLQAAQRGSSVHIHALAAIIWHEMAHMDGADEPQARKREEALWTRFVRDDVVDRTTALRYLKALNDRRH